MAKKTQQPIEPEEDPEDFELDEEFNEDEEPEVEEFMEIGGSPVPGLTLRQVLHGHAGWIGHIAWSPDGHYLASPSQDSTIRIWDMEREQSVAILDQHKGSV